MTGAHKVHVGGTNLDLRVEEYIYERKTEGIYIINLKRTLTSWDTFYLKIKPHTLPRRSATSWDPETQTAQRLHTLGWGRQLGDLTPRDRETHCPKLRKGTAGHTGTRTLRDLRSGAQDALTQKSPLTRESPEDSETSRYTNSSCDATPSDTHPQVA